MAALQPSKVFCIFKLAGVADTVFVGKKINSNGVSEVKKN
jgi:hypothetical protein